MTRRNRIILASAALAILLLSAPASISAKSEASAQRAVNLDDATYAEKLQAVKDGLAGHSASGAASSTYQSIKDKLTGNTFDTSAARDTLIAKLQPTLFERVQQKLTGHPTTAERIQGAIDDVASDYGVDSSTLSSYAKSWGLSADNLLSKSAEVKNALLSKTEPTLLEKVRQKLTGHPTNPERIAGAIDDVAKEYGVDAASLRSSAASWGISAENFKDKAQDVKDALLSKTEPTLVEKLRQRVTGHPTNSERAAGAISELSKEYGVHPDQLRSLASKHSIELPSSASDAKDAAVEQAEGMWSRLSSRLHGTKVAELLGALSPEEREARLRKVRVQNEAHDALDEALEKLYSAHGDKKITKVDVNLKEKGLSFGARLSNLVGSSNDDYDTSSGSSLSDTLSSYKDRILGGSLTKEQLEKEAGADPTLLEKIQRAITGHPTDAERAASAGKNAVGGSSVSDTISSYYDSIKNRASSATTPSTSSTIGDKLEEYKNKILGGSLTKAELEKQVGADPTLLEKIQRAVTGHPTDAERLAGAAKNAVGGNSITDTVSAYYDSIKNRASSATTPSTSSTISDKLEQYKNQIMGGKLTKAELEKQVGADPTLLEKIRFSLTGHPTDAERLAGAAKNAASNAGVDTGSLKDTVSAYYDSIKNKVGGATEVAEPTLMEKIQQKLTGHPTTAERAAGAASNAADRAGVSDTLSATTEKLKGAAIDAQNKAYEASDPTLLEKIQHSITGHPTTAERAGGAAHNLKEAALGTTVGSKVGETLGLKEPSLTDRIKSSLGFREPTLAEKLTAAAEDLKTRAQAATSSNPTTAQKLQQAASDLADRAKSLTGAHEDTYAEKLQATITDLQARVKAATGHSDPTLAERLQATIDSLNAGAKEKLGYTEPSLTDRIKDKVTGAFQGSDKVVVDKQRLKDAEAAVKAAKRSAKDL